MWLLIYIKFTIFVIIVTCDPIKKTNNDKNNKDIPALLIVSYDGFRNEFFNRNVTNYFNTLRMQNVYAGMNYECF